MDRRTIIEEAAGITKFRVRQRAAEARLESARANLSRVSDIISEIERQVNSLRRQAAKARRYRIQREELRELLRRVYVAEEINLKTLLEETQAQLANATEEDQRLATELSEREEAGRAATQTARMELLTHTAASERLNELTRQLENALEKLAQQAEGFAREGERAAAAHAERTAETQRLNQQVLAAREKLGRLTAEREAAVKAVIEGHERVSDTDAEQNRVRDEYSRSLHRMESYNELDQRRAHYSLAVQEAFSVNETEDFHLIGTLADKIRVDEQWERAVEGAFGSSLQSILVPTPDDAIRAAGWLKNNHAGRATFLVTGLHGGREEVDLMTWNGIATGTKREQYSPGGIDGPRIGDILNASRELLDVLERTMPERMNARIVDTLDDAVGLSLATSDMFVTIEGDWVTGGQFVNAGNGRALEEGAGLLTFKRELSELESRVNEFGE